MSDQYTTDLAAQYPQGTTIYVTPTQEGPVVTKVSSDCECGYPDTRGMMHGPERCWRTSNLDKPSILPEDNHHA